MNIFVERDMCHTSCTVGKMYVNGDFFCYSLEDMDRKLENGNTKVPGQTAIPRGKYEIVLDFSNRFQRELPRLLNVPGFSGVRIHPGNTAADTEGCILVGLSRTDVSVGQSRAAFNRLWERMNMIYAAEPIWIEIA